MVTETKTDNKMSLKDIKGKKGIDLQEFNFVDTKIDVVEMKDYSTEEEERLRILVQTEILKEGTKLRGTEFITLFRDNEGIISYSESPNSNARKLLDYFEAENFEELKGKDCKVVVKTNDNGKKNLGIFFGK